MSTVDHASRREPSSARWMAWVGAVCALLLASVAGVCSMNARAVEQAEARWVPTAPEPRSRNALSADVLGQQQRLVGVHTSPAPGQLELPRPTSKPPLLHPRANARLGPALRPEALLAERTRRQLSCVVPTSHGRIADRPVVANCPAQGPPRTA
ncbi:hypothetical protein NR798_09540 [Archangium gephyra]|uniref:hypothetical protein n=1 Tax=Archangium gephyra TaxID=48 RepID=UPI0035D407BC